MMKMLNGELVEMTAEEIAAFEAERAPKPEHYETAIKNHIEAVARSRGYDSQDRMLTYVGSSVPAYAAEAAAYRDWRDQVWAYVYQQMAAVQSGQRSQPTPAELVAELPQIVWPS